MRVWERVLLNECYLVFVSPHDSPTTTQTDMTVTEFSVLLLRSSDLSLHSPPLAPLFTLLSERQSSYSGFPLRFYINKASPCEVYLISGWKDVPAHNVWIASEGNQELLRLLEPYLTIKDFIHLDVPFETMPEGEVLSFWEDHTGQPPLSEAGVTGKDVEGGDTSTYHFAVGEQMAEEAPGRVTLLCEVRV